jgi:hypothetical protein
MEKSTEVICLADGADDCQSIAYPIAEDCKKSNIYCGLISYTYIISVHFKH